MNPKILTTAVAGLGATVAIAVAAYEMREARTTAVELVAATEKRDAIVARVADLENKRRLAERRAAEAENDSGELLRAVASVRKQQEAQAAAQTRGSASPAVTVPGLTAQQIAEQKLRQAQVGVQYQQGVVGGVGGTASVTSGPRDLRSEAEQERLAHERAYQQVLAKTRTDLARASAEFSEKAVGLDRAARFNLWVEAAEQFAATKDFQTAIRFFNQAMGEKPAGLPLPDSARALQAALQVQNSPLEITLNSDGATFVSIQNYWSPRKIQTATFKILPGDYFVLGRRAGFRDVVVPLQVRGGMTPPVVTVVCTQPVAPR